MPVSAVVEKPGRTSKRLVGGDVGSRFSLGTTLPGFLLLERFERFRAQGRREVDFSPFPTSLQFRKVFSHALFCNLLLSPPLLLFFLLLSVRSLD